MVQVGCWTFKNNIPCIYSNKKPTPWTTPIDHVFEEGSKGHDKYIIVQNKSTQFYYIVIIWYCNTKW
jgi:hypothetical protein